MKIALAQLNYHIGNFEGNISKIKSSIIKAKEQGADLVVFAELAISGYPPRDFLEFSDFIHTCYSAIENIASECVGIAAIVGSPSINNDGKGKPLYNSAFFLENGKIKQKTNKSLLPNYDIFDEYRYFEPSKSFEIIEFKDQKIALTICEDIWDVTNLPLYTVNPMEELIKQKPDLIINIAASPFHYNQEKRRKEILLDNVKKYKIPLVYVNHVGAQTELIFDGGSMAVSCQGKIVEELKYFHEDFRIIDINLAFQGKIILSRQPQEKIEKIHDALVLGVKDYFGKLGFEKAILGLSGGIDSAVCLAIAVNALGSENVQALLLPSHFSTEHSITDAVELAKNLNVNYEIINILESYNAFENTLKIYFKDLPFNTTEENIQARIRGVILMAFANKFNQILLNTSNKSEGAVGYGTLYGDMNGGLSVLGDIYKTEVFELATFINKEKEIIPLNTIKKPPSAELSPNQKDSDSLPDYEILDKILFQYIELRKGPKEIKEMGFDEDIVNKILRLVNMNEYKRYQSPPILRVSPKAFGIGRRMPIVGKYLI